MPAIKKEIFAAYKDPDDVLDFSIDYTDFLRGVSVGVTIAASTWSQTAGIDSLTLTLDLFSDTATKVRVAGGTVGETYRVTNRITLTDGQIKEKSIDITIEEE